MPAACIIPLNGYRQVSLSCNATVLSSALASVANEQTAILLVDELAMKRPVSYLLDQLAIWPASCKPCSSQSRRLGNSAYLTAPLACGNVGLTAAVLNKYAYLKGFDEMQAHVPELNANYFQRIIVYNIPSMVSDDL